VILNAIDSVREMGALHLDTGLPQSAHGHTLTVRTVRMQTNIGHRDATVTNIIDNYRENPSS
jgi:hypothetical protein